MFVSVVEQQKDAATLQATTLASSECFFLAKCQNYKIT